MQKFTITDAAAKQIKTLIENEENKQVRLRISVDGGGCSGFQYRFDFDDAYNAQDDTIINHLGVEVIIDDQSLTFISGSQLDYVEALVGASFVIDNPNATASCGCGNSFSV